MTVFSLKTISTTPTVSNQNYKETVDDGACCIIEGQNDGRSKLHDCHVQSLTCSRKRSVHRHRRKERQPTCLRGKWLGVSFFLFTPSFYVFRRPGNSGLPGKRRLGTNKLLSPATDAAYHVHPPYRRCDEMIYIVIICSHMTELPCLEVTLAINLTRPSFNFVLIGRSSL